MALPDDAHGKYHRRRCRCRSERFLLILLLTSLLLLMFVTAGFESLAILTSNVKYLPESPLKVASRKKQFSAKVKLVLNGTVKRKRINQNTKEPHFPGLKTLDKPLQSAPMQEENRSKSTSEPSTNEQTGRDKDSSLVKLNLLHFETPLRTKILVLTLSGRKKFSIRQAIRRTWKKQAKNVFFVIGNRGCTIPPLYRRQYECVLKSSFSQVPSEASAMHLQNLKREQEQLKKELETYQDILFVDMVDAYRKLPRKLKLAYRWAIKETSADWIVKADDDFFVHVARLGELVIHHKPVRTVLGRISRGWPVPSHGKWAELNYKSQTYPPFPLGSCGHMVSRDVANYIVKSDQFEYQGEDVSVGIWLDKKRDFPGVKFITSRGFTNEKACADGKGIVVGHDITPLKMELCSKSSTTIRKK